MRPSNRFPCSLHEAEDVGKACCLYVQRSGWRGGGGGLLTPWVVVCAGGACSIPCFSPKSSFLLQALYKLQLGFSFLFFGLFLFLSGVGPTAQAQNYFWGPCNFFAFCFWRRHVSMCKRSSKGSQVPVCFIIRRCD